jgi:hypothetical protein
MASLARIPFSKDDEGVINGLNTWMMVAAIVHFIGAALFLPCGCFATFGMGMQISVSPIGGILGVVQMLCLMALGVVLIVEGVAIVRARGALEKVVSTDQNDQELLSQAFRHMRLFFTLELAWFALNLLVALLALVVAIVAPELAGPGLQGLGQPGASPFGGGGGFDQGGAW